MFKELEDFKNAEKQIADRLESIRGELYSKRTELNNQQKIYETMLNEETTGQFFHSLSDLKAAKQRVADLTAEVELAEQRIKIVERGKAAQLGKFVSAIISGADRENIPLKEELEVIFEEVRGLRAKMLLALQRGNAAYTKMYNIAMEIQRAERMTNNYVRNTGPAVDIRTKFLDERGSNGADGLIGILPNTNEFGSALHLGKVPEWVQKYKE